MKKIQRLYENVRAYVSRAQNTKVVVLGHQKSGTTAIGSLLACATGLSFSNDPIYRIDKTSSRVLNELMQDGDEFVRNAPRRASHLFKGVVKDPDYVLALDTIVKLYPNSHFVFIARHPLQIVRSIFNRLNLDGKTDATSIALSDMYKGTSNWDYVLNGFGGDRLSVVERLAQRIEMATRQYLLYQDCIQSIKYEDFLQNKQMHIEQLAKSINLEIKRDISHLVDIQFQPKGNAATDLKHFFGRRNLQCIKKQCPQTLAHFHYL